MRCLFFFFVLSSAFAHEPLVYFSYGFEWPGGEVLAALTERTRSLADDRGGEFIHRVQHPSFLHLRFHNPRQALGWVSSFVAYKSDLENYGSVEAWANPEATLELLSGDCEDQAILLASLLRFHTADVLPRDRVYVKGMWAHRHAVVVYYSSAEEKWYEFDPVRGAMIEVLDPGAADVWINDREVRGPFRLRYALLPKLLRWLAAL